MYTVHTVIRMQTFNIIPEFTLHMISSKTVCLRVSYSREYFTKVEIPWKDLWNSLFIRRGNQQYFPTREGSKSVTRIVHPMKLNDRLLIYIGDEKYESKISVKWGDLKQALITLRRRHFNDRKLSNN